MGSAVGDAAIPGKLEPASLASESLGQFLAELCSSAPTPGGGAASAVAGALAASLVAMVAELSVGRPKSEPYLATIELSRAEGHRLASVMTDLADADAEAFGRYMAASAMPRGNEAEIAARRAALARAADEAIEPPRAMVAACAEVAVACERLAGRSNRGLASDLVVASRLVEGAAHGAMENVLVNLPALGDTAKAEALAADAVRSLRTVVRWARAARATVARKSLRDPERAPTGGPR
jgi:glutamate formiminotransferase/formiminotetrahydrofolate cyclodeaminase